MGLWATAAIALGNGAAMAQPQPCLPTADGLACEPVQCPVAGQECIPRCVTEDPATGATIVTDCDCRDPNECHLVFGGGVPPSCQGTCPPGMTCITTVTTNADGTITTCCDCVPIPCPLPPPPAPPLCQAQQDTDCLSPGLNAECLPKLVSIDPNGAVIIVRCECFVPGNDCGPVDVQGTILSCPGLCPVPPFNPNDVCQIHLDGVPSGQTSVDGSTLPPGTLVECACNPLPTEACCFQDGSCQDNVLPADCLAMGGTPQGPGSACQGTQACCLPDGTCSMIDALCCLDQGGTPQGAGSACGQMGACCLDGDGDGISELCTQMDSQCCASIGGTFQGAGSVCLGVGACCFGAANPICVEMDELCCDDVAGTFLGIGSMCLGDADGNGIDDACEPQVCGPAPGGQICEPVQCPVPTDLCQPRCVVYDPATGAITITDCECRGVDVCHVDLAGLGPPCVVPDIGGTAGLPPVGCAYATPDEDMVMDNGLPMGSQILIDAVLQDFMNIVTMPGGALGGEIQQFDATLVMPIRGTGALAGFNRFIPLAVNCETQTGPRTPGDPVQTFPNEMFQLQGQLFGDPDFCFFTVIAGTDFGLPSPGHTTLTQQPGGDWAVDSFFDITYEITFQGCAGSILEGMGGTSIGTIRFETGVPAPPCAGNCPPGENCVRTVVDLGDGTSQICCDCVPGPPPCGPTPDGSACEPVVCPTPGEECLPTCMSFSQGVFTVLDCACRPPTDCHIEFDAAMQPICVGDCPPGQVCEQTIITTPDGFEICCECVPFPQDCQPTQDGSACEPFVCPVAGQDCVPRCVREDPATGQITVIDCDCRDPGACQVIFAGVPPFCDGNCPPGMICITNQVVNSDGTIDTCCDCVLPPCECLGDINGDGVLDGLDIPGFVRCLLGTSLPIDNCGCADINGDGVVDPNDIPGFVQLVLNKAPCGPTPCCPEEDLVLDLATGVEDGTGNFIPIGSDDDTWIVTVDPSGGFVPRPATVITPHPAWSTIPGTQWISAAATGPNGFYTYQFCFCLDPRFTNAHLVLDLRADDNAEVFLNGTLIGATPVQSFNSPLPTHIDVTNQALFVAGENCIEVVVRNQFGVVTGLNLAGSVTATSGKCCCPPEDLVDDADSGVDDTTGGLIPIGNDDDTWEVTVDPSGGSVPRAATVIAANPAWLTIPGTQWISAALTGPNGFYTYRHCFCLDPRFKNPLLVLDLRADDNAQVFLNGNLIGSTPIMSFNTPTPTHIVVSDPTLFQPCDNCIEVVVQNQFGVVTGLNISGQVTAIDGKCCDITCRATSDGLACEPVQCPTAGEECVPRCVQVNPGAGTTIITDCDCRGPNDCQVNPAVPPGVVPDCINGCPPGFNCVQTIVQTGDLIDVCCDCEPIDLLGACCVTADPDCFVTTQADCTAQGGIYLGDGTVCGGQQACCLANGACIDADVACCQILHGGTPQGAGTHCLGDLDGNGVDDACEPPPPLSCCDANGLCIDLAPGVTVCPPGMTLVNGPCGLLQACCFPDGTCLDAYVPCCLDLGGQPQGPGTDCTTVNCPPPPGCGKDPLTGFCLPITCPIAGEECLPTCIELNPNTGVFSAIDCACRSPNLCHIELLPPPLFGFECFGTCPPGQQCVQTITTDPATGFETICCECQDIPQGSCCDLASGTCFPEPPGGCPAGSTFHPNPCQPPQGCCLPDDTCLNIDPNCCADLGGTVTMALCTGNLEGCCLPDGTCKDMDRECCTLQGGTPTGGTLCAPPEACCLATGACIDTDPVCCQLIGGMPQGAGSVCLGDGNGNGIDDACEPPGQVCPMPPPQHCIDRQDIDCVNGPPGTECLPRLVIIGPAGTPPFVELCACFLQGEDCGPIQINGPLLSCQGVCPVPPQGNQCVIHLDGVSTGLPDIDSTNLPPGTSVTCDCSP